MSDNKLINRVIEISTIETKAGKFGQMAKIKDERGLTYTVYEQKKDGSTSTAWDQLRILGVGSSVQISFVEEIKSFEGKSYTARTIRAFNQDIGNGARNKESFNGGPPTRSQGHSDAFGRRLAIHGMVNGMLAAGATVEVIQKDLPALLRLEDAIDKALSQPVEDLPVIDMNEPDDFGNDIPFN